MREAIAQMLKVEAEAKRIVSDADAEAAKIVQAARVEAVAVQEQARSDAQVKATKHIEDGVREAQERRTAELAQIDAQAATRRNVDPGRADAAKQAILAALTGQS